MCDFDVTRPPVTLPPFLSRDGLGLDAVAGLFVEFSDADFSVESLEAISLSVSDTFEVVFEDLRSSSLVEILASFSVFSSNWTAGSSFAREWLELTLLSATVVGFNGE